MPDKFDPELKELYESLLKAINKLRIRLNIQTLIVDHLTLVDVIKRYTADVDHYIQLYDIEPDIYKKAAYWTFWIRKLKPLYLFSIEEKKIEPPHAKIALGFYINEYFGSIYSLGLLYHEWHAYVPLPEDFWNDLVYSLRYRAISPHSIALIYKAISINLNIP